MRLQTLLIVAVAGVLIGAPACTGTIDLAESVEVTDVFSGWYDFGVVPDPAGGSLNKLVPSISFRLKNAGDKPLNHVQLTVSFWQEGDDGERDSREVQGIGSESVPPGGVTEPILVRAGTGYTLQQPRAELFMNSQFKDWVAKVFAKRSGKIQPLGEFTMEHRIIPQTAAALAR